VISIIIPTLNAQANLPRCLAGLANAAMSGLIKEVIVSDGGSTDDTLAIAEASGAEIVAAPRSRAKQLIAAADKARGKWMLFVHPETALAPGWDEACKSFISGSRARAAVFRLAFDDASAAAKRVQMLERLRGRVLTPHGDQGLLISRIFYDALGGYADLEVMEDVDLARRIGWRRLHVLDVDAVTSADKYRRDGYAQRAWRNIDMTARYLLGADPKELIKAAE